MQRELAGRASFCEYFSGNCVPGLQEFNTNNPNPRNRRTLCRTQPSHTRNSATLRTNASAYLLSRLVYLCNEVKVSKVSCLDDYTLL